MNEAVNDTFEVTPSLAEDNTLDDTTEKDSPGTRKLLMLKVYGEDIGHKRSDNTQKCINTVVRNTILPKMKFVPTGNGLGSFEKPDFTNTKSWVNILFSKIPSLDNLSDGMKCKVWITYRMKVKEQFSLHRAGVTLKIQNNFIKGTMMSTTHSNMYLFVTNLTLLFIIYNNRDQKELR